MPLKFSSTMLFPVEIFHFWYVVFQLQRQRHCHSVRSTSPSSSIQDFYVDRVCNRLKKLIFMLTYAPFLWGITSNASFCLPIFLFELLIQVFADLDILEHTGKLVNIVGWHANFSQPFSWNFFIKMQNERKNLLVYHSTMFSSFSLSAEVSKINLLVKCALWNRMNTSLFWTYFRTSS